MQLASNDFETREQALGQLIANGQAVLPLAAEFAKNTDPEVSTQAKGLHDRILLHYDGYLPTDPSLKAALKLSIELTIKDFTTDRAELLRAIAKKAGIQLRFDSATKDIAMPQVDPNEMRNQVNMSAGEALTEFLIHVDLAGVPRCNEYIVTTEDTAQRLALHRHRFKWSELGLGRDEADRAGNVLKNFFPSVATEIQTGSESFAIRGEEDAIPRAARLIALLKPGAPDAIWPAQPGAGLNLEKAVAELQTPTSILLSGRDEPATAIAKLAKEHHEVVLVPMTSGESGEPSTDPAQLRELQGAAPLHLALNEVPLGLLLHWIEKRTRFVAADQAELRWRYEIGPGGRLQFRVEPRMREILDLCVGGADVGFLYPRNARPGSDSDTAARQELLKGIRSHLLLLPSVVPERDIAVLRGRLLMQGNYATLARILDLVRQWRAKGQTPAPAEWQETLERRLNAQLDWDGREMTGGILIPALRKMSKVNILLEESADGRLPSFSLSAEDSQLLPPGKHSLRELLDDLMKRVHAEWKTELGVVIIVPGAPVPDEK